jgi:hypothetical protein
MNDQIYCLFFHTLLTSPISLGIFLAIVEMSSGFRSSCYWTDWNWANTENIRIGLVKQNTEYVNQA